MIRRLINGATAPVIAGAVAIVIAAIAVGISGNSPTRAFSLMWSHIDSLNSTVLVINRAVPYYVSGIAVAIGFKMNLFNIGSNGQYLIAALFAAQVGAEISLPAPLHVAVILLVAMAVGAAWASIPAILKVTRGVHEVISSIMLNTVATGIIAYLLSNQFRASGAGLVDETEPIPSSGQIPPLNGLLDAVGLDLDARLQGFLVAAIVMGIGYHILLNRSRFGFNLRVSGENPTAARASGVSPKRMVMITLLLSGAMAGLIGMGPLLANPQFHKFGDQFPTGLGFTGLAIALLGRNHPVGVAAAALIWATIERAVQPLSPAGIPSETGIILQGSFLLSAVIAYEVVRRRNEAAETRRASLRTTGGPTEAVAT